MYRFLLFRDLYTLYALEFLHAVLHLLGLGGLIAEALDERLHVLYLLGLRLGLRTKELKTLLALVQVVGIPAGVDVHMATIYLADMVHHGVYEGAVVAYHEDGAIV